jgi:hypothetical protein
VLGTAILIFAWFRLEPHKTSTEKGKDLNQRAWEATFAERGLSVPDGGPRDGWDSDRLFPKESHPSLVWIEPERHLADLLEVDSRGLQHWRSTHTPTKRILLVGGSVAFGICSSSIDQAYFTVMGRELESRKVLAVVDVFAGGAWKSVQDVTALELQLNQERYDLAIIIDGVNDLTVGASANSLYSQAPTHVSQIGRDLEDRIRVYTQNIGRASLLCEQAGVKLVVVLQPTLLEQSASAGVEREVMAASISGGDRREIVRAIDGLRRGLQKHAEAGHLQFLDASRIFREERATTFSDIWHFSDPGHRIFGIWLAEKVSALLDPE